MRWDLESSTSSTLHLSDLREWQFTEFNFEIFEGSNDCVYDHTHIGHKWLQDFPDGVTGEMPMSYVWINFQYLLIQNDYRNP